MKLRGRDRQLPEGARVVVMIGEEEPYELIEEEDEELWRANLPIERGVPAEMILAKLRRERDGDAAAHNSFEG